MNSPRSLSNRAIVRALSAFAVLCWLTPTANYAAEAVQFRKPGVAAAAASDGIRFRSQSAVLQVQPAAKPSTMPAAPSKQLVAKPLATAPRPVSAQTVRQAPAQTADRPAFAQPSEASVMAVAHTTVDRTRQRQMEMLDYNEPLLGSPVEQRTYAQSDYCVGCNDPACGIIEPACGCGEPTCGICEPGCGIVEPGCGVMEPACGLVEPGCGLEPTCGLGPDCGDVACGSCVGRPGPDYWCFPVCLPRFKDLSLWGGVHGFKGPRDAPLFGGSGDGNFGFQEGINLGGRAPLVGLLFPQLSYQLGYQAVQSHLSGTSGGATNDRSQNFVTAGLFRRIPAGLQFGVVWDYMDDDWIMEENFQQIRYEVSVRSQRGREFGFIGSTHTNSNTIGAFEFQAVDQYRFFFRCNYQVAELRFWGGFSNDSEGIFGGDCYVPFNDRWSLQTGFNYLIPDVGAGTVGAREEAWNIGMNLVWHYGRTAKQARYNPHRPLFSTADNGSMFIDQTP